MGVFLRLLLAAGLAYADQYNSAVLHMALLVFHQFHHLLFVHLGIGHAAAHGAVQMAVPGQRVVKAVSLAWNGHPAHPARIHQTIQVTVYGAKAQARAFLDRSIINFLGGGVVAQVLHRLHDQLTLFGISHIVLLFLCFWVLGVRRGSDVLFALIFAQ